MIGLFLFMKRHNLSLRTPQKTNVNQIVKQHWKMCLSGGKACTIRARGLELASSIPDSTILAICYGF